MDQDKKAQHETDGRLGPRDYQTIKKACFVNYEKKHLSERVEITTLEVYFEGHSPKWRVLSKCSFQHCNDSTKMLKEHVKLKNH